MTKRCEWQPIDTAPRDGSPVLLFRPNWEMPRVGSYSDIVGKWQEPTGDLLVDPTWWMEAPPLPEQPKT